MVQVLTCAVGAQIGAVRVDSPEGSWVLVDPGLTFRERAGIITHLVTEDEFEELRVGHHLQTA